MAKSQQTFNKKEKEKNRLKKQKEKQQRREERKANAKKGGSLDDMIAYVDANGNITDTPPDPAEKEKIDPSTIEVSIPRKEEGDDDPIRTGIVEFFNDAKGFGFIKDLDSKEKIFVHVNNTEEEIREGNKVSFEVEQGLKGPNAIRVSKI